jgi:dTDP-6-deoxy-L-talose 4-dehydrogenase (NAD+)
MIKILVTGATGFIGKYVVKHLLSLGHTIITTARKNAEEAASFFPELKNTHYIQKDLNDREENYYSFFSRPDIVIHTSWEGLPNYDELYHIERNLISNYYFIKNIISNGLRDITITGTCLEYGLLEGCLSENANTKPCTNYGLAKDTLRKFVETLQNNYSFVYKWLRLFYPYGRGQQKKSLWGHMQNAISTNAKEFNMSPGEQLRDFFPIEKAAEYIVSTAIQNEITGIINCCSGKPVSVRRFAEKFFEQRGYPIKLNLGYYSYSRHEPLAFWGDNKKLLKIVERDKRFGRTDE